jgi:hypothetical protein
VDGPHSACTKRTARLPEARNLAGGLRGSSTVERSQRSPHPGRHVPCRFDSATAHGCPLVHVPFSSFVFLPRREKNSSSSKGCGLWGQVEFGLVGWSCSVWMTTGSDQWMLYSGSGQQGASCACSTEVPICPHLHPQLCAELYPSPVGQEPRLASPPIGVWVEMWASCA